MLLTSRRYQTHVDSQTKLLDGITPVAAYDTLRHTLPGKSFLLESAPAPDECARYSIIGIGSIAELNARAGGVQLQSPSGETTFPREKLLEACRQLVADCAPSGAHPPFLGAYGVAAFELAGYFEELGLVDDMLSDEPDLHLIVPQTVVVFDHFTHKVTVSTLAGESPPPLQVPELINVLRGARLEDVALNKAEPHVHTTRGSDYQRTVSIAKEAVAAGDVFQIVLSQQWQLISQSDPLHVYRSLRSVNPSPYMFYVDFGWGQLLGSSPEALCRLDGRRARVRPLAGTRPRPHDVVRERVIAAELQRDPKERAEHVMLVDLARNDLGRVCNYGSVEATDLFTVERYSHVMHLASEVQGTLRDECDAFDLFAATFPAGTVSGAPKIRAMQLIAELEGTRRGHYGGSVAYFGFDGSLDACITLRSAFACDGKYAVRAGAGIVADSIPEREDAECSAKARAVFAALEENASVVS